MKMTLLLIAGLCASVASADAPLWTLHDKAPAGLENFTPGPRPTKGQIAVADRAALEALLSRAPREDVNRRLAEYGLEITLPLPDGTLGRFAVADAPVFAPELAAQFPSIRTYIVQGLDDAAISGRMEVTQRGVTAMLRWPGSCVMLDIYALGDASTVVSYHLRDLPGSMDWGCSTREGVHGESADPNGAPAFRPRATTFRTYRLAMACTGEWGLHQCTVLGNPPNTADPIAAIATVVSRTNATYEIDLGVRFLLVPNNASIVYINPATDPYSTSCDGAAGADCSGEYLTPNRNNLSSVIGNTNFDIGHLMTRVFGGVAYLGSVCTSNKAGGISGIPRGGDIDPVSALVVIHEIGHQFGAGHTFNGIRGRCLNNVSGTTAWEPGSGSSPMAYAGGCPVGDAPPTDNIVQFADPYFMHGSLLQMQTFIAGTGGNCDAPTTTTNNIPVINSITPANLSIPPSTPFELTVDATDPEGDVMTFSWEQYDRGPAQAITAGDNGTSPLFRVFPPVTSPTRTFPRWSNILNGPTNDERLPSVLGSIRKFRVLIRDNRAGAGGTLISPFVNLTIASGSSAFAVTAPVANADVNRGSAGLAWSVGNTNVAPIGVANVKIELTRDEGATFTTLLASTTNDGSQTFNLSAQPTGFARFVVRSLGNVFFAVSPRFRLTTACGPADFNGDEALDFFDYLDFVAAFSANDPVADFNLDGTIDFFDYLDFVAAFSSGGC
ncbi:MAG: hypothetical protein KGS45_01175 [Planctomycetes bacterium]|nr:hypothetical protein [Planctomycetota bacterium]